jgi:hypothetical protein
MTFRREDNGEVFEATFLQSLHQDVAGFIVLEDGTRAKRVQEYAPPKDLPEVQGNKGGREFVSDSLGFPAHQLADFEEDRVRNGFVGVSFTKDPGCQWFYQVRISDPTTKEKYLKHRQFADYNRTGTKDFISQEQLDRAKQQIDSDCDARQAAFKTAIG